MNPALSVIFFTVMSGTGYGLLFLLGAGLALEPAFISHNEALVVLITGLACASAGLLSSTLHLGQPQRAWRAFSQWRSSWLSREGVVAMCGFVPALLLGLVLWTNRDAGSLRVFGAIVALFSIATVVCTAGIYFSLKTIHAWHNRFVLPGYLLLGLLGGCVWLLALLELLGAPAAHPILTNVLCVLMLVAALCSIALKRVYWHFIDTTKHPASTESATGLGRFGSVRSVEAPHTEQNYLTNEMGFMLARKHAKRLRAIASILIGLIPVIAAVAVWLLEPAWSSMALVCAIVGALAATLGLFVERWLFFAEARHAVMLYYGVAQPVSA